LYLDFVNNSAFGLSTNGERNELVSFWEAPNRGLEKDIVSDETFCLNPIEEPASEEEIKLLAFQYATKGSHNHEVVALCCLVSWTRKHCETVAVETRGLLLS
jgi:hypothetical protein